jgi:formate-dependent nitrite reductase membrane component NrfD
MLILGKTPLKDVSKLGITLISISSFVIIWIIYLKVKKTLYKYFTTALIVGHLPLLIGFVFTFLEKNYLYLLISFPVFLLIYIILIPKGENSYE